MSVERADELKGVADAMELVWRGDVPAARDAIETLCPFEPLAPTKRRFSEKKTMQIAWRDGFIDRYSGERLVNPGALRVLAERLGPEVFPFHPNWRMDCTHLAFWDLFPTIDHVNPVAREGLDSEDNLVITSMRNNGAKSNWPLEDLPGWMLYDRGDITEWDGLTSMFVDVVEQDSSLLRISNVKRWYAASKSLLEEHLSNLNQN